MENQQLFQNINKHPIIQILGPMDCDRRQLKNGIPTIFIDGGAKYHSNVSTSASYTIGDADGHQNPADFDQILPQNKDISDLGYVLENLQETKSIFMEGFSGGRLDHQLFVYGEVHRYISRTGSQVIIDQKMHWPGLKTDKKSYQQDLNMEGLFSIGCFEDAIVNITGDCEYPLKDFLLEALSSRGLSNVAKGKVSLSSSKPFWIYLP